MKACDACNRQFDWTPPDLESEIGNADRHKRVYGFLSTGFIGAGGVDVSPADLCRKCTGRILEEIVRQFNEAPETP